MLKAKGIVKILYSLTKKQNIYLSWQYIWSGVLRPSQHSYGHIQTVKLQSTLVISKSKGLYETLRDIRTSTYQICGTEENNESNNHL